MKTYIVYFEFKNALKNTDQIEKKLRAYNLWAKLGTHAYLIVTENTAVQVRDDLKAACSEGDLIFVGTCPVPSAWSGLGSEVSKWILEYQPKNS